MVKLTAAEYDRLAAEEIVRLLDREHAVVWPEVEAKLAERPHPLAHLGINPHHLTNARRQLHTDGIIEEITEPGRGRASIPVVVPANRRRRATAIDRAAARKRLLQSRYRGWAETTSYAPNMLGTAGERVAHASLLAAAAEGAGYLLARPDGGQVANLFGKPIPGGPLDDAAFLTTFDPDGMPVVLNVLVEVKNIRHWIYPGSAEIFQLLDKATRLQLAYPAQHFVPILICRRAHHTAFGMAKEFGFLIMPINEQPILPHSTVTVQLVEEVRDELGYDLRQTDQAHNLLVSNYKKILPANGLRIAQRWKETATTLGGGGADLEVLRKPSLSRLARQFEMERLREISAHIPGAEGRWRHESAGIDLFWDDDEDPPF